MRHSHLQLQLALGRHAATQSKIRKNNYTFTNYFTAVTSNLFIYLVIVEYVYVSVRLHKNYFVFAKDREYKWKDVSISDMYRYIGLLFYMAMVKLSSIRDCWWQDSIFSVAFPAVIMSRDRYRTISWNVHMSHPDQDKENDRKKGTAKHDCHFRVKPLMDTIHHACKAIYHHKRNLAVDERMVPCKVNTGLSVHESQANQVGLQIVCPCWFIKWIHCGFLSVRRKRQLSHSPWTIIWCCNISIGL